MMTLLHWLDMRFPAIKTWRPVIFLRRIRLAFRFLRGMLKELIVWLFKSNELSNFTYDLTDLNKRYLASAISGITGRPYAEIAGYISELEKDDQLRAHIRCHTLAGHHRIQADAGAKYGRRLGWYAIVRAMKPKIVVETGVDKGLGSCVLTAALMRNAEEGYTGRYFGTDINPGAGYLLRGEYAKFGEIVYGDSLVSLRNFYRPIDVFINDSDHSDTYEEKEYETIREKLSPDAIVLGDNSHCNDKLLNFATTTGRRFIFLQEHPKQHWYPGAGIGIAYGRVIRRIENIGGGV